MTFALLTITQSDRRSGEYKGIILTPEVIGVGLVDREPVCVLTQHLPRGKRWPSYTARYLDGTRVPDCSGLSHYTVISRRLHAHFA